MSKLKFDDGIKSYDVNGVLDALRFNPTDEAFLKRLFTSLKNLDEIQDIYKTKLDAIDDGDIDGILAIGDALSEDMRKEIDKAFGYEVPVEIWNGQSLYAMSNGMPIWCHFLLMVMDECYDAQGREQKAVSPALARIKKKYKK